MLVDALIRRPIPTLLAPLLAVLVAACAAAPPSKVPTAVPGGSPAPVATATPASTGGPDPTIAVGTATPSPFPTGPTATPAPSIPPVPGEDQGMRDALQGVLDRAKERRRIPGLAGSVVFADGSSWAGAAGLADVPKATEVTQNTRFAVGSITKTFVAALVMQLVEEQRIALEDPLSRYVPDFPNGAKITLRQLLSHRSGIYNYFESSEYNSRVFRQPAKVWTVKEILGLVKKPYFAPGTGFHYSNTNYVLLGMVIEQVTGEKLAAEIRDRFLEPLELHDTYLQGAETVPKTGAAHGYLLSKGRPQGLSDGSPIVPNTSAVTVAWAAGAMSSTVRDLARWATALYTGVVVTQESLQQMVSFDTTYAYGLGTRTARFELSTAWGHTGSLRGFTSAMWYFPKEQMTVVVTTNLGRINPNQVVGNLARASFRRLGIPIIPAPSPAPGVTPSDIPVPPGQP